MADSKISDLTAGTVAAADDIVFVQSGTTKTDTVQGILDLVPASNSIYNADDTVTDNARVVTLAGSTAGQYININTGAGSPIVQFNGSRQILIPAATEHKISGSGEHNVTLGGALSTDKYTIQNSSGTDIASFRGDNSVDMTNSVLGIGQVPNSGRKINIYNGNANGSGVYAQYAGANGVAFNAVGLLNGNGTGVKVQHITSGGSGSRIGVDIRVENGLVNTAINIQSGDIALPTSTGTKIGTTTSQLLGFWNTTPIAQPSSTGETTGFTAGAGTGVNDDSTFTGNVGSTAYRISDIVKHLKNIGLIAS